MEKALNKAIWFGIIGLASGVYYREFTKFIGYSGETFLSIVHPHTLILGVFFTLVIALILNTKGKTLTDLGKDWFFYEVGLYGTLIMLLVRGHFQALEVEMTSALDASISGIAGIAHIILGVFFIKVLWTTKKFMKN